MKNVLRKVPRWVQSRPVIVCILFGVLIVIALAGGFSKDATWDRFVLGALFGLCVSAVSYVIERMFTAAERQHEALLPKKADMVLDIIDATRSVRGAKVAFHLESARAPSGPFMSKEFPNMLMAEVRLHSLGERCRPVLEGVDRAVEKFVEAVNVEPAPASLADIQRYAEALRTHELALESALRELLKAPGK